MHKILSNHNMLSQKELIFQDVFETALDHGTFDMVEELYEYLNLCNIKGNSALDNIFFNAIRKHNEILNLLESQRLKRSKLHDNQEENKQPRIII